ncbi:hypothetical protein SAMN05216436_105112 [bacterium A37T11]|nr:hypothetical protein SAMN05216436_105112 [bacterium A37T11]
MKKVLILAMGLFSFCCFAQNSGLESIDVVYPTEPVGHKVAVFVNGQLVLNMKLDQSTIEPYKIADFKVVKRDTTLNGCTYDARILITTKSEYAPSFISLNQLKRKYTNLNAGPTLFMIDDEIISSNYDEQVVDEKNILRIVINKIDNPQEKLDINVVKLLTKSEAYLKKPSRMIIRGNSGVVPAGDYMDNVREKVNVEKKYF